MVGINEALDVYVWQDDWGYRKDGPYKLINTYPASMTTNSKALLLDLESGGFFEADMSSLRYVLPLEMALKEEE